jgi:hypothetical protein
MPTLGIARKGLRLYVRNVEVEETFKVTLEPLARWAKTDTK